MHSSSWAFRSIIPTRSWKWLVLFISLSNYQFMKSMYIIIMILQPFSSDFVFSSTATYFLFIKYLHQLTVSLRVSLFSRFYPSSFLSLRLCSPFQRMCNNDIFCNNIEIQWWWFRYLRKLFRKKYDVIFF